MSSNEYEDYEESGNDSDNYSGSEEVNENYLDDQNEIPDEEEAIKEELEEMELGKLLKAKIRLENGKKLNSTKEKANKKKLNEKFEKINKEKSKKEPKEFSALVKPKKNIEFKSNNENKALKRDPRFDELSGTLKPEMYKKNYSFVKDQAKEYLNKINQLKKKKEKNKIKLEDDEYQLMKHQINYVKGWVKSKDFENTKESIKQQFKEENKSRAEKGLNPVYVKESVMKKLTHQAQMEKRGEKDMKNYLKRKKHREIVKTKKQELN